MAEEPHNLTSIADGISKDDESVMRDLLKLVKGLSPISVAPMVEGVVADDQAYGEQFEFE